MDGTCVHSSQPVSWMTSAESSAWVSGEVVEAGQGQAEKTVQGSLEVTLAEGPKLHGELTW